MKLEIVGLIRVTHHPHPQLHPRLLSLISLNYYPPNAYHQYKSMEVIDILSSDDEGVGSAKEYTTILSSGDAEGDNNKANAKQNAARMTQSTNVLATDDCLPNMNTNKLSKTRVARSDNEFANTWLRDKGYLAMDKIRRRHFNG